MILVIRVATGMLVVSLDDSRIASILGSTTCMVCFFYSTDSVTVSPSAIGGVLPGCRFGRGPWEDRIQHLSCGMSECKHVPGDPKGCCLDPKGWLIDTPYHQLAPLRVCWYISTVRKSII